MIGTIWPLGRVTKEFSVETDEVKRLKEQQTWCVALVSKTQEVDGKEGKCEVEERKKIPLKLETDESGCSGSEGARELCWSCELRRVMSCWHWVVVNTVSGESDVPIADSLVMVDETWCALAWIEEDLGLTFYPRG